jgi:pilus assembly protein CpaC
MVQGTLTRIALCAAAIAVTGAIGATHAAGPREGGQPIHIAAAESSSRFVPLGIGKSVVIDLPKDVKDVLVADPKIANAVVRTSRRAYLIGVTIGQTSVYFFDAEGQQIAGFDIAVTRDLNGVRAALRQMFPNSDIRIDGVSDGVVLSGVAASPLESQQAYDIAARLVGDGSKVTNALSVKGRDQVMLKVTVAEIQRDVIKQLGIDLNGALGNGSTVLTFLNNNPFTAFGAALAEKNNITGKFGSVTATLRAMERAGVVRTLAEPNLSAISGETANFLAGGEFPLLAGYSCDPTRGFCQPTIQFKKFGVSLGFTPVVLSEGRISLKVMTEVSELSLENALTITGLIGTSATVPSIKTRRADTTVEIPSGGVLAMAGMIQEQTKQQVNGLPGMMQLPVLGPLFRSRDYVNRQTELVVFVAPYVVRAVAAKDLSRPDDGFADAPDPVSVLMGRLNRIYGVPGGGDAPRPYHGSLGFILD